MIPVDSMIYANILLNTIYVSRKNIDNIETCNNKSSVKIGGIAKYAMPILALVILFIA